MGTVHLRGGWGGVERRWGEGFKDTGEQGKRGNGLFEVSPTGKMANSVCARGTNRVDKTVGKRLEKKQQSGQSKWQEG